MLLIVVERQMRRHISVVNLSRSAARSRLSCNARLYSLILTDYVEKIDAIDDGALSLSLSYIFYFL